MLADRELRTEIEAALAEPTLCGAFQVSVRANAGRPALRTFNTDEVVGWDDYGRRVRAVATGLSALGVRAGNTVALLLRNRPVFNVVDAAALHLGAVPFSIYHTEPVAEMLALVEDSGARVIVTEPRFLEKVRAVVQGAEQVEHVILDGDEGSAVDNVTSLAELEQLRDEAFDFDAGWRAVTPESIATLVYTSGTTGKPKAVQIPHRAIMHSLRGVQELAPSSVRHRGISFLPASLRGQPE